MAKKFGLDAKHFNRPSQYRRETLVTQLLWLIKLRWIACVGIVVTALVAQYAFPSPVLSTTVPIYICAGVLFLCNIFYFFIATKDVSDAGAKDIFLGIIHMEADLIILTVVFYFSGGVVNPFVLFYLFHVIIATIILPKNLSYTVGLTAIFLFGLLVVNELEGGLGLGYYPLQLSMGGGLWRNPVYALGVFTAFSCTVMLSQYLTRKVIIQMTAKEIEAARHSDLLKAIIGAMSEGLIFVTYDGNVAICNPAAELWKKHSIETINDSLENFPSTLTDHINQLFSGDDQVKDPKRIIEFTTSDSKPRYIEAKSHPVAGIDGKHLGYVVVGQDLTEHKKLESDLLDQSQKTTAINEMLKVTRIEMAQREKMVAIGQMATGIAHEIGNPLASLSSLIQYMGRKLTTHEEKESLLIMESQISRISNILKRMLTLSRPATAEYKWVDISDIIDSTLSLIRFDKRIQSVNVENVPCSDLPMVWLNPQLFEQVLLNLFINALDAMDAKDDQQQHILNVTREFKDKMIEVRISDSGVGMNPEICKRAFESFFTTKEIGKGTGLGLFICYNLINEIDGTIALESELGKGTTVVVRIPVRPKNDLISGDGTGKDFVGDTKVL